VYPSMLLGLHRRPKEEAMSGIETQRLESATSTGRDVDLVHAHFSQEAFHLGSRRGGGRVRYGLQRRDRSAIRPCRRARRSAAGADVMPRHSQE